MEYACRVANAKLIVVLGHTNCNAIINACNDLKIGHFTHLLSKIKPAVLIEKETINNRSGSNPEFVTNVSVNNIMLTIRKIREKSSILSEMEDNSEIKIVGALYNVEVGEVVFF